jgi:hypothetical protein
MYDPNFIHKFCEYLDPESRIDEDGEIRDWKDQSLVENAPQSAIDAFNRFKELEAEAEKEGKDI